MSCGVPLVGTVILCSSSIKVSILRPKLLAQFCPLLTPITASTCCRVTWRHHARFVLKPQFFCVNCSPIRHPVNLLKPTGPVMHQQFNIQQLYALPTLYLCVIGSAVSIFWRITVPSASEWSSLQKIWRHYGPTKHRKQLTQWHSVTTQKTSIIRNIAVRTVNVIQTKWSILCEGYHTFHL